jgi:ribosome biogenesis protein BRX1
MRVLILNLLFQICEVKNCNKCIFFACAKKTDLYMWVSNVSAGPSAKFLVQNGKTHILINLHTLFDLIIIIIVYTMGELKMTGNSLRGSRPLLSFDKSFEELPQYQVLRELLVQTFGTPNQHPKSQPFYDHVITFTVMDNRIWFRNYQIVTEDGSLAEIGINFLSLYLISYAPVLLCSCCLNILTMAPCPVFILEGLKQYCSYRCNCP